ncbi:MAG: hypothetical protein ABIN89_07495 [Chitinophagaceae bacterium]
METTRILEISAEARKSMLRQNLQRFVEMTNNHPVISAKSATAASRYEMFTLSGSFYP